MSTVLLAALLALQHGPVPSEEIQDRLKQYRAHMDALRALQDGPVTESDLKEFFARAEDYKAESLEKLEAELTAAKRGRVSRRFKKAVNRRELRADKFRYEYKTDEDKDKTIERLTTRLEKMPDATLLPRLYVDEKLEVGHIGRCPTRVGTPMYGVWISYSVFQVIDENSALISAELVHVDGRERSSPYKQRFWLADSTKGMIDGRQITPSGCYKVSGTRQYTTALGGSKTVFVLSPFDVTPYLPGK